MDKSVSNWITAFGRIIVHLMKQDMAIRLLQQNQAYSSLEGCTLELETRMSIFQKGSTSWLMGKTEIPGGFLRGCAIAVKSDQEIWLIGGLETTKRILSFDVNDHTFKELPFQLNVGRKGHRCALIPNTNKVMVTGGDDNSSNDTMWILNSTEILDTEDGSVSMASPMNSKRSIHGMGVLTIKGEDRLTVFGGYSGSKYGCFDGRSWLDSVETYNSQAEKWETSDIKLSEEKDIYGSLTVKISDIFSELQSIND